MFFVCIQAEWDADNTDCQGKTRIKTDFFHIKAFLIIYLYRFNFENTGLLFYQI